eukprot:s206_g10.t1
MIRKWIVDRGLDIDIEVDGGIKADNTIFECADAGANCFIAGSGLFAYDDLSKGVQELKTKALEGQKGLETSAQVPPPPSWDAEAPSDDEGACPSLEEAWDIFGTPAQAKPGIAVTCQSSMKCELEFQSSNSATSTGSARL